MRWGGHVACFREMRNGSSFFLPENQKVSDYLEVIGVDGLYEIES
jgi:hypothetical protein